jgi:hypothetical protein
MARARKAVEIEGSAPNASPAKGRAHTASYSKIRGEPFKWFIRIVGPSAEKFSGREIPVTTKSGEEHAEKLSKMIWNGEDRQSGENVALYEFLAKPKVEGEGLDDEIPF